MVTNNTTCPTCSTHMGWMASHHDGASMQHGRVDILSTCFGRSSVIWRCKTPLPLRSRRARLTTERRPTIHSIRMFRFFLCPFTTFDDGWLPSLNTHVGVGYVLVSMPHRRSLAGVFVGGVSVKTVGRQVPGVKYCKRLTWQTY